MAFQPSPYQQAIYNEVATTNHNINVNAVAGSGKTTTLLGWKIHHFHGLQYLHREGIAGP